MNSDNINDEIQAEETLDSKLYVEPYQPTELDENYKEVSRHYIPESIVERYAEAGYDLQWIRVFVNGIYDLENVKKKELKGYSFVLIEDVPEMKTGTSHFFEDENIKHKDLVIVGTDALVKFPFVKREARRKHLDEINRKTMDSVNYDIRSNNISGVNKAEYATTGNKEARSVDFGD